LVVPALMSAATWAGNLAKAAWAGAAGAAAGAAGAAGQATAWGVATGAVRGFGIALHTALGPIGWIMLGVTAIGAALWATHKAAEAVREEQKQAAKDQASLVTLTDQWAESTGKAVTNYKQYAQISASAKHQTAFTETVDYYEAPEQKPEMEQYAKLSEDQKVTHNTLKYIDLIKKLGMNTKQAQAHMTAFFRATGMGLYEAQLEAAGLVEQMGNLKNIDWGKEVSKGIDNLYGSTEEMLQGNPEKIKALGLQVGAIYNEAVLSASSPKEADAIYQNLKKKVVGPWEKIRQDMLASGEFDATDPMMKNANELRAAYMRMSKEQREAAFQFTTQVDAGAGPVDVITKKFLKSAENAEQLERALMGGVAEAGGLNKKVDTLGEYIKQAVVYSEMLTFSEAKRQAQGLMDELFMSPDMFKKQADSLDYLMNGGWMKGDGKYNRKDMLDIVDEDKVKKAEVAIRAMADANNIKPGKDILETYFNLMHNIKKGADDTKDAVKGVGDATNALKDKSITIKMNQVGGIVQTAMSNVQSDMADSAMSAFDARWDNSMEAAQDSWDARSEHMQASHDAAQSAMEDRHERAQNAMDRQQENAQAAFDARWEKRKEAVTKVYDKRIEGIQREIEAEQKADEVRQRLFEKEKARLARLAELENADIDFQTAITEGRLDDAAKTMNNAGVSGANALMDAEQAAAEARTQARIDALEKKNERLEKQRDKELKQLEKMEARLRRHLERIQDRRRRHLEKMQEQETNALQKSQERQMRALEKREERSMESMEKQRDYEKELLDERLELFKAYTARNQKDLERWMRKVGLTYDDFGTDVKAKGESWSKYFERSLAAHSRQAGTEVMNDNRWEDVGKKIGDKLLKGLGFDSLAQFNKFVRTGTRGGGNKGGKGDDTETQHAGGIVGSGGSGRGNIPNSYKGLHRSEQMVRAQKGEYVINRDAAQRFGPLLDSINSGTDVPMKKGIGGLADSNLAGLSNPGYGNVAGLMSGVMASMWAKGVEQAFQNNYEVGARKEAALARAAAATSGSFKGMAGTYGGRFFSKSQMRNAATIASVGAKMGMNSRDIMIGIMTAITESGLVNIKGGHLDSQGLFQQRPSMGWGTVAQVTDPEYAARAFFGPLRGHAERSSESPWLAAQHIQRSAFSDGSNYRAWWNAAQAIWDKGLKKQKSGGTAAGYVPGKGGRHRPISTPVSRGLHGGSSAGDPPAVDLSASTGHKVYAVADGVITSSRDIAGPLASDTYNGSGPYGSYGRVIQMRTDSGAGILYGHLSQRFAATGQRVTGGSVLGLSGNTGNSSGPHLHFGATNGPYAWLRTGGTLRHDNVPVIGHRGETMLDAPLTKKFRENVAGGGGDTYKFVLDFRGATIEKDVDIERAVNTAIDKRETKRGRTRVVK
jgi:murein DD-endopeptidase MepM/ murein hydrolase activator NlpD/chemotaxis protein histidine kinase CheA